MSQAPFRLALLFAQAYIKSVLRSAAGSEHSPSDAFIRDDEKTGGYLLKGDLWTLRPATEDMGLYLCDTCGCMLQYDTHGICLTKGCKGHPKRVVPSKVAGRDRYYKELYRESPLPISANEHTAQLSTERARKVQQDFIDGKINVLSCTTTFELGVDVGDLRATFMRNVAPSPANYTQRAGRVGRRAGKPGFAVTFARLRPHDIEYYRHPERVIAGVVRAPSCYLANQSIAIRHVFAVVLSEFFRHGNRGEACAGNYNDFMCIAEERPKALDELRDFIAHNREDIDRTLADILPEDVQNLSKIGLASGGWIEQLIGDEGRLLHAHSLLHDDWDRLDQAAQDEREAGNRRAAGKLEEAMEPLAKKKTISVLAESGVLPKYGFPTDLVKLSLVEQEHTAEDKKLDLTRGMRQAIREYAPGSVVVADKKAWKSVGILKPRQRPYEVRQYGECKNPDCQAFVVPIATGQEVAKCPVCGQKIKLTDDLLIPSSSFRGREFKESPRDRKRRNPGKVEVKFVQDWDVANPIEWRRMPGGKLGVRHAANGRLFTINKGPGKAGFSVCSYCGAAAPAADMSRLKHESWCKSTRYKRYASLGTDFVTDVLELTFDSSDTSKEANDDWLSLRWALVQAAVSLMNVPESEIGATNYRNHGTGQRSVLIYDNVPGGAGRALQLSRDIDALLERAYEIVDTCDCDEDTCCYGCLCSYYNQNDQGRMSRGAARDILGELLGKGVS